MSLLLYLRYFDINIVFVLALQASFDRAIDMVIVEAPSFSIHSSMISSTRKAECLYNKTLKNHNCNVLYQLFHHPSLLHR